MSRLSICRSWLIVAVLVLTLGGHGNAVAQSKAGPLVVLVSQIGKATIEGESKFLVELRNTGVVALALPARPDWDVEGQLQMRIRPAGRLESASRDVPGVAVRSRDNSLTSKRRIVELPSGEALALFRTLPTRELFDAPGEYDVVVVYRGLGGGEVVSEPLRVIVVK